MFCRFPLSRFTMNSQRNRIKSFGQDWRKRLLHLWENDWNTWRVERFCVLIVQTFWLFQPVRDIKFWGNGSGVCTRTHLKYSLKKIGKTFKSQKNYWKLEWILMKIMLIIGEIRKTNGLIILKRTLYVLLSVVLGILNLWKILLVLVRLRLFVITRIRMEFF